MSGKLGLFGGSFDPVHCGHLQIAERSREVCGLDKVLFLPCSRSPLKQDLPRATDGQRLDMLRLATAGMSWAGVDGKDLEWAPPSWSWRLAEWFHRLYSGDELFWIMGADQWRDLERWGRWEYLASLVTFVVHHRGGENLEERQGVRAVFVPGDHPASATVIREGGDFPEDWLPEGVREYIRRNALYRFV